MAQCQIVFAHRNQTPATHFCQECDRAICAAHGALCEEAGHTVTTLEVLIEKAKGVTSGL